MARILRAERRGPQVRPFGGLAEVAAARLRLVRERDEVLARAEAQVVDIALAAAKHLVGEALAADPSRIVGIVRPLVERARHAARVTLRIHPDDHAALADACATLGGAEGLPSAIVIVTDASVTRGGCVVETDAGTLDARLEVRLGALREALLRP